MSDGADAAGEFVSRLSHALRTPLALILGYAELLGARGEDEDVRREAPFRIQEAAEQLSDVVDDLIVVLAIDANALFLDARPLELAAVVSETVRLFEPRYETLVFSVECEDCPPAFGDPEHVPKMLRNLLLNSCRRSPDGGRVVVSVRRKSGFAEVSVSDEGVELTEQDAARVFDRSSGVAVRRRGEAALTGLELYKVRRLVELHGGAIGASGSTFAFTLPLDDAEEVA